MFDGEEYPPSAGEPYSGVTTLATSRRSRKNKNKKRFSDEQIRSLETIFESESRLEPRKKLQLAKELGLQPRQVAIWFQNKRARWKSKQLERDYSVLQSNYNSLASRFETLKKEKQALVIQLQKLNGMMQKPAEEGQCCEQNGAAKGREGGSGDRDAGNCKTEEKPSLSFERSEHGFGVLSDEDSGIKTEYFGVEEEPNLVSMVMVEPANSLTSQEDWGSLDSDGIFDHSTTGYQWWDFWA